MRLSPIHYVLIVLAVAAIAVVAFLTPAPESLTATITHHPFRPYPKFISPTQPTLRAFIFGTSTVPAVRNFCRKPWDRA